jgi:hypothetical protein
VAIVGAFSLRLEEDKSDTAWKPIWVNKKWVNSLSSEKQTLVKILTRNIN